MIDDLGNIIEELGNHLTHKDRPFTGQPHTDNGERGKTEVKGIRFRDLADCVVRAIASCALDPDAPASQKKYQQLENGTYNWNDLFDLDLERCDPVAIVQNVSCEVEKMMDIYPNIPGLNP